MADFEQVLTRAIAGLPNKGAEHRRILYDRARNSLIAQLKALDPPLPQTEIAKQRLALEHAIRRVEGQVALQEITQRDQIRREEIAASTPERSRPELPAQPDAALEQPFSPPQPKQSPSPKIATGRASAQPSPQELEAAPAAVEPTPANARLAHIFHQVEEHDDLNVPDEYSPLQENPDVRPRLLDSVKAKLSALKALFTVPDLPPTALDHIAEPIAAQSSIKMPRFGRGTMDVGQRRMIIVGMLVLVTFVGAGVILMSSGMISQIFSTVPRAVIGLVDGENSGRNKLTQRLDPETEAPASAIARVDENEEIIPVAQTAILYEENPAVQQQGEAFKGQVLWKVDSEIAADGKPEKFLRGTLEVPQRKLKLIVTIRRNLDASLPASHTVELLFDLPPDFVHKSISSIPGVLMKPAEQARGVPLVGASARITSSYFLIGLSNLQADKERNILMLKDRSWIEVPILYESRLRAVLVMEKGTSGERMFRQVFASWKQ